MHHLSYLGVGIIGFRTDKLHGRLVADNTQEGDGLTAQQRFVGGEKFGQGRDGKCKFLRLNLQQLFKKNGNAEAHAETFISQDIAGPGVVAGFATEHGDNVFDMTLVEEVGNDPFQFLVTY